MKEIKMTNTYGGKTRHITLQGDPFNLPRVLEEGLEVLIEDCGGLGPFTFNYKEI